MKINWRLVLDVVFTAFIVFGMLFISPNSGLFAVGLVLTLVVTAALIVRRLRLRVGEYYDLISGIVQLLLGVISGVVAVITYLPWQYASMLFMIFGGSSVVGWLWRRGWGYQAIVAMVILLVVSPMPFLVTIVGDSQKAFEGDYSSRSVCETCETPADGGVVRTAFVGEQFYCHSCFQYEKERIEGHTDCQVKGCDEPYISPELTYCQKHAAECELCGTPINPDYRWCDACTKAKIETHL